MSAASTNPADATWAGMDIAVQEPVAGMVLVRVCGALDVATAPRLCSVMNRHLLSTRPCRLVLDLSGITLLSHTV